MQRKLTLSHFLQSLALAGLILLTWAGRAQVWMIIFAGSVLLALGWGRMYCKYVCPINALMGLTQTIRAKAATPPNPMPNWAKHPMVPWIVTLSFVTVSVLIMRSGLHLPVKLLLVIVGGGIALIYTPAFWHRLCPYGTILSIPAAIAKPPYQIDEATCINCGLCIKVCPADAIARAEDHRTPVIRSSLCLLCEECVEICPKDCIS